MKTNAEIARDTAERILHLNNHHHEQGTDMSDEHAASIILAALDAATEQQWQTGIPVVPEGGREMFWCATINPNGKIFHRHLAYLNGYIMPLSDSQDDPGEDAVPVGDDGDYAWSGWYEESCDQCETQWKFNGEIKAWMKMPQHDAARKEGEQTFPRRTY